MDFQEAIRNRKGGEKIVMLTAYDYQMAKLLDEVGIDLILVGDSLGMVFQGHPDTKSVRLEHMVYHTEAVARGAKRTPIIGDLSIHTYDTVEEALKNAKLLIEAGAHGVKLEGLHPEVIRALIDNGIPVMGHVGMLPQTAESFKVRGKDREEADKILQDAIELDKLGVFAIVLECIPESLAKKITESVSAPTIGIGAGRYCDGQVLVINDLLGMDESFKPKFVKRYAHLARTIKDAVRRFTEEVRAGVFPDDAHTYH